MDKTEQLLKELTEASGISGYEDEVRAIMRRELRKLTRDIRTDRLGSIMGIKRGKADSPRVMIIGHMDEVGFMVKSLTPDGYIKFLPIGGWWGHVALGQRMRVLTDRGPLTGVVGARPPHLLELKEREKVVEIKDMFIDVGVSQRFDARKLSIQPGDPIVPESQFTILANPEMYMAKAFDNRVACAAVLDTLRKFKNTSHPNTLLACASVQEEVGLRGATTLAYVSQPDVCIVIDTGIGQDIPPEGFRATERLGNGVTVFIYDSGMIPNVRLRNLVMTTAKRLKIPFHLSFMERGATDGGRVHLSRAGVPTITLGPPVRYIHSHNAILNRKDYDATVKLVTELVKKLDQKTVSSLIN